MILLNKYTKLACDEIEDAGREISMEERLKLVEENFNAREEYFKYISFIENTIKYIKQYESKITNNARNRYSPFITHRQTVVDDIKRRVMSALGNDVN